MRRLMLGLTSLAALLCFKALAQDILPATLHALPVHLEIPFPDKSNTNHGSGMYVDLSNREYFVTARHCLYDTNGKLRGAQAVLTSLTTDENGSSNVMTINLAVLQSMGLIKSQQSHDVAVVQVGNTMVDANGKSTDFPIIGVSANQSGSFVTVREEELVLFTNVPDGNAVLIFGYPVELLDAERFANETNIDLDSPLIRRGVIS